MAPRKKHRKGEADIPKPETYVHRFEEKLSSANSWASLSSLSTLENLPVELMRMTVVNISAADMLSFKLASKTCYAATKDFDGSSLIILSYKPSRHEAQNSDYWANIKAMRAIKTT